MESFGSFLITIGPSELPALVLLGVVIFAHRKAACGGRLVLIYGLAIMQVALPMLMLTSVILFGHNLTGMDVARPAPYRLTYLPIGLYLLQGAVGSLIAFFITRSGRIESPVRITGGLVATQMAFSLPVAIMTALQIT